MKFSASAKCAANGKKWQGMAESSFNDALHDLHSFLQTVPDDEAWSGSVVSDTDLVSLQPEEGYELFYIDWSPKAEMRPDPDAYRGTMDAYKALSTEAYEVDDPPVCRPVEVDYLEFKIEWEPEDDDGRWYDIEAWEMPYEPDAHLDDDDMLRGSIYDPTDTEPYELMEEALCRRNGFAWDADKFEF